MTLYVATLGVFTSLILSCGQQPAAKADQPRVKDTVTTEHKSTSIRPVHWGYEGDSGPSSWSTLSPTYALCAEGKQQSPINILKSDVQGGKSWKLDYKSTSFHVAHTEHMEGIVDNGHTIQVNVDDGSTLTFDGKIYTLKQFHFHTPSEHTFDGKHQPMEMHLVHQSEDGSLAVIGVLIKVGKEPNPSFEKIIANLPGGKGESKHFTDESIDLKFNLKDNSFAYHYVGSLTTPPCSENVQWLVLREMLSLTVEQIDAFSSRIAPNNRPTQEMNERTIQPVKLNTK